MNMLLRFGLAAFIGVFLASCGPEGATENGGEATQETEQQGQEQSGEAMEELQEEEDLPGQEREEPSSAQIDFEKERHDFGTLPDNEEVTTEFKFTNTGDEPLVIRDVDAGCGCTAPSFSDEPVQPGNEGYIEVAYDTGFRDVEHFSQRVTVYANTPRGAHNISVQGVIE